MKNILLNIFFASFTLISCQKNNTKIDNESFIDSTSREMTMIYNDSLRKVHIKYINKDSLLIMKIVGADTLKITLPIQIEPENLIPNNALFINDNKTYFSKSGYFVNDSLFLLPLISTFNHLSLYGINFKTKKIIPKSNPLSDIRLTTYIDAFIYNVKSKKLVISNSYQYDDEGNLQKLTIHFYEITNKEFRYVKSIKIDVPSDLRESENSMNFLLKKISKIDN